MSFSFQLACLFHLNYRYLHRLDFQFYFCYLRHQLLSHHLDFQRLNLYHFSLLLDFHHLHCFPQYFHHHQQSKPHNPPAQFEQLSPVSQTVLPQYKKGESAPLKVSPDSPGQFLLDKSTAPLAAILLWEGL